VFAPAHPEARDRLASVYGWFTEGFDTGDLKEAKALLGAALAMIRDEQLRREPEARSDRAPRRRDQSDARLFKVG